MTDCQTNTNTNDTNTNNKYKYISLRSSPLCRAISIMGEGAMTDCQTKTSRYCLSSPYYTPVLTTTRTRKKKTSQEVRMLSRTWQSFVGSKNGNENFRQARIYNFRIKFVVFARNRKFAKLTQRNMQYKPCHSALLAQETRFLTQKSPKISKSA